MTGEVIKSFLVGLGFDVDDKSLAAFNKSIQSATLRVTALYGVINTAAAGIFASITSASKGFEDMGYQLRIVAPAMNRWLVMRQAMLTAYSKAGVNLTQTVQEAIKLNYAFAKTKFALEAVYKSVAAKFFPLVTKQLDIFRLKIFANMPKIQAQLQRFVEFIFKAFSATVELGSRLYSILTRVWDFFVRLDKATNGWSTIVIGLIAAWKLLNLAFLATPLGMLLAGLTALLALFDDFKVWEEGGKSLFDWGPFVPVINAVTSSIEALRDVLGSLFTIVFNVFGLLGDLFTLDFTHFKYDLINTFSAVADYVQKFSSYLKSLIPVGGAVINWAEAAWGWAQSHLSSNNAQSNVAGISQPRPLVAGGSNSNQNVNQQTSIVVNGAADANAVGKHVAGQQDRVNFDMTRNLKGAMQ